MTRHQKGFTIVELLITVAIIGVLTALSATIYGRWVCSAREAEAPGVVQGLVTAQVIHQTSFDTYVACAEQPRSISDVDKQLVGWTGSAGDCQVASWAPPGAVRGSYYCTVAPRADVEVICGGVVDGDGDGVGTAFASAVVSTGLAQAPIQRSLLDWLIPSAQALGYSGTLTFSFEEVSVASSNSSSITSAVLARIPMSGGSSNRRGSADGAGDGSSSSSGSGSSSSGGSSSSSGGSSSSSGDSSSHGRGWAYGHDNDRTQGRAVGHGR